MAGFRVAHGPNKNSATGALIFDDAKTEKEARRMFREYVENTYPVKPEGFKTICYVLPLEEVRRNEVKRFGNDS